jgi:hypothetical protein
VKGLYLAMKTQVVIQLATLWMARICAVAMFLFWGAFFVEHLQEWFFRSDGRLPPPFVWCGQALHLAMLLGLVTIIFRPGWGAIVTTVTTVAFFASIGLRGFPYVALLNLPPVLFAVIYAACKSAER